MTPVFADSFYFLALLNERDDAHERAVNFATEAKRDYFTTVWVLTEVADACSHPSKRSHFVDLITLLEAASDATIIKDDDLFQRGVELYGLRADKYWSLTDCISFVVMDDHDIVDALTGDRHFEQAGFNALLKT